MSHWRSRGYASRHSGISWLCNFRLATSWLLNSLINLLCTNVKKYHCSFIALFQLKPWLQKSHKMCSTAVDFRYWNIRTKSSKSHLLCVMIVIFYVLWLFFNTRFMTVSWLKKSHKRAHVKRSHRFHECVNKTQEKQQKTLSCNDLAVIQNFNLNTSDY